MQNSQTGEGYRYLRDRSRGVDVTIYFHQLAALRKGHTVEEVFDETTHVHHIHPIRFWNCPENVDVVEHDEHQELHGRKFGGVNGRSGGAES